MAKISLHFRIDSIRVLEFYQKEPEKPIGSGEQHAINISLSFGHDKNNNKIRVVLVVDIRLSDETSPVLVSIETAMVFAFREGELFDADKDALVPKSAMNAMASITYSTTRGILFAKVGASTLANLILPPISIADLVKQVKPIGPPD